jgi:hypothetical protein
LTVLTDDLARRSITHTPIHFPEGEHMAGKKTLSKLAVFFAVVAIVPVAGGVAAVTKSDAVPHQLVGCWHRHVGALPVGTPAGVWLIQITRAGKLYAFTPGMTSCTGVGDFSASVSVAANRLTIGHVPVCANEGVYSWKASGKLLALRAASDPACPPRLGLFVGVWKRK